MKRNDESTDDFQVRIQESEDGFYGKKEEKTNIKLNESSNGLEA